MVKNIEKLLFSPIDHVLAAFESGACSSVALTEMLLEHVEKTEPHIHAYITLDKQGALQAANESDNRRKKGDSLGLLDGIPVSVKDLIVTKGLETTAASKILKGYTPPYDATVVQRLRNAGAVIVGKNNLDEFAMGSSTEHSAFGPTHNPFALDCVPGGSSGGSAASVAAGQCYASLGTDTGGSIRQPAAFCGVVGLKPSYGRVSRYGAIAFASSLDQIGPIGRTAKDTARLLQVIAGHDEKDSTSSPKQTQNYLEDIEQNIEGLRVALVREAFDAEGLNPEIAHAVQQSAERLKEGGAKITEVSIPSLNLSTAAYYLTCTAEASSNLARYDGVRYGARHGDNEKKEDLLEMYRRCRSEGFGPEVKRRIILGTYALSAGYYDAYYLKAQKVRTLIVRDFAKAFEQCDALLLPTSPFPAFRLGEKLDDPLQMYLADIYTIACNLAGLPGLSMPAGLTSEGLPIGTQLIAPYMQESTLLRMARVHEELGEPWTPPTKLLDSIETSGGAGG